MVVRVEHINAVLHPFVIYPATKFAPLVLDSSIRVYSDIPEIFEFPCRLNVRVSRLRSSSPGCASGRVARALLVIGTFLFNGCVQINQNLVVIGNLCVPFTGRILVSIQVDHIRDEGTGVESGGLFTHLLRWDLTSARKSPAVFPRSLKVSARNRFSSYLIPYFWR